MTTIVITYIIIKVIIVSVRMSVHSVKLSLICCRTSKKRLYGCVTEGDQGRITILRVYGKNICFKPVSFVAHPLERHSETIKMNVNLNPLLFLPMDAI